MSRAKERPQTATGRELLSRTKMAADALTKLLRSRGVGDYNLGDWMPSREEIVAIEREAQALANPDPGGDDAWWESPERGQP